MFIERYQFHQKNLLHKHSFQFINYNGKHYLFRNKMWAIEFDIIFFLLLKMNIIVLLS